ncbi:hypothetical protein ACCD10_14430 [Pseudomonas sp. Pseusp122]|jgi:hypothetical protein|uniref:hypothetical protein n=1 Tax=unclassified Pseudomonas TaxID=196821 RepID=UPI0021673DB3|nr:hypothetical protein [Pseudomonas sp. JUb42]MCS3471944.1 hypothetical protein [Pseudomonas sp. JUb42]
MASIKQISPCTGWNYVHKDCDSGKLSIHPVAAWALLESGEVIGMISIDEKQVGRPARLSQPPAGGGYYVPSES